MPRVVHFEIHAGEPDRAERFYREVFGWEISRWEGPVDYRLITTGPDEEPGINGAIVQRAVDPAGAAANAYVCTIGVEDIGRTEQAIRDAGGTNAFERMELPGVGQLSYWQDTEGNTFGVLQPV